ncbi:MAG: DUF302 domain-containing protein [Gammaproteobacteria bacterium]|nr:DUF302 domain-containing protein [Gammaproteobacteria bacterium]
MLKLIQVLLVTLLFSFNSYAESPVYTASVKGDFNKVYQHIYKSLESNRLFVVFEPDIGSNISGFAKRWGDNYNRNKLDRIKSMVFCNGWYANEVSNKDVNMTALCPLHITLTHRDGVTSVHFVRPDLIAKNSKAASVARELSELVIKAIKAGIKSSQK